jgi:NADPH:quinone reductase-like Zn-dependent oxidoreductase
MTATQMRAVGIRAFGSPSKLEVMSLPVPEIGPDDVLIRVQAAGVGPWDCSIRHGDWGMLPGHSFPLIIGAEGAGVVERTGANVTRFHEGDEVYYYAPPLGSYAEYVAVPAAIVASKPATLDFVHAAAVPCSALTAHQVLTEALALAAGETLYMTAAAGGTGTFAVQIARHLGAEVIATASAHNHAYVQELGASEVIDYRQVDVVEAVRARHPEGVAAAFDVLGGESLSRSLALVRDGGRLAYITLPQQIAASRHIEVQHVVGQPNAQRLEVLAQMIDAGSLQVYLETVLPLEEAAHAHELIDGGHVRGKIVLQVDSST